jgi:glycosyltransferase involved in cell wall biosynthesis
MAAQTQPGEIIVVDNNSDDRTAEIAARAGARVVFEPVNQISRARNTGAAAAQGQYLIFLDADTELPPALLTEALGRLAAGRCCGGGATLDFDRPLSGLAAGLASFWNFLSRRFRLAAGSFVFCLREGFQAVGGFSEKVFAGEEIRFSRDLRAWGRGRNLAFEVITDPPVITSSRKFRWYSSLQLLRTVLFFGIFPFAVRFRRLCSFWYLRK